MPPSTRSPSLPSPPSGDRVSAGFVLELDDEVFEVRLLV